MQVANVSESRAINAAIVRVGQLPSPRAMGERGDRVIHGMTCGDGYPDDYHDAYGDDPYVDCPYDDYEDN